MSAHQDFTQLHLRFSTYDEPYILSQLAIKIKGHFAVRDDLVYRLFSIYHA